MFTRIMPKDTYTHFELMCQYEINVPKNKLCVLQKIGYSECKIGYKEINPVKEIWIIVTQVI